MMNKKSKPTSIFSIPLTIGRPAYNVIGGLMPIGPGRCGKPCGGGVP
jgi:hypothetical protein